MVWLPYHHCNDTTKYIKYHSSTQEHLGSSYGINGFKQFKDSTIGDTCIPVCATPCPKNPGPGAHILLKGGGGIKSRIQIESGKG